MGKARMKGSGFLFCFAKLTMQENFLEKGLAGQGRFAIVRLPSRNAANKASQASGLRGGGKQSKALQKQECSRQTQRFDGGAAGGRLRCGQDGSLTINSR
jgi:hypothetical protein